MADVGKVGKNKSGPEPIGPKRKKGHDSEAFKEMMKVGKVREVDPEEKRNRKRQAEIEEEQKAKATEKPPHQGLKTESKEPSPYVPKEKKALGAKESKEAGEGEVPPPSTPPPFFPPSGEFFPEEPTIEAPQKPDKKKKKKAPPPKAHPTSEKKTKKVEKKKAPTKATPKAKEAPIPSTPPFKKEEIEKIPLLPLEKLAKPKIEKKKEKKEIAREISPPLPTGSWEKTKSSEKEEKQAPSSEEITSFPSPPSIPTPTAQAPSPLVAPFTHLPPQIANLFERMVGVMTVMHEAGISQTTINLDNPQFAESVFFGAQIVISEFSTAPKAFNIELLGNTQATKLFAENVEELVAAFQGGNYTFSVNRIDTGYLPTEKRKEARRVKRKKSAGG